MCDDDSLEQMMNDSEKKKLHSRRRSILEDFANGFVPENIFNDDLQEELKKDDTNID